MTFASLVVNALTAPLGTKPTHTRTLYTAKLCFYFLSLEKKNNHLYFPFSTHIGAKTRANHYPHSVIVNQMLIIIPFSPQ